MQRANPGHPSAALTNEGPNGADVLTRALVKAGKELGFTQAGIAAVVGRDRTALSRAAIEPDTKSGELALLIIRAYRALYVLVGGDPRQMKHWMHTYNLHVGGIPADLIGTVPGLVRVVEYLDSIRGRV